MGVFLRNVAVEAVRLGEYFSENQSEVLRYIADCHAELLADTKKLTKYKKKWSRPNALTRRYNVQQLLSKAHQRDGYDVFANPEKVRLDFSQRAAEVCVNVPTELQTDIDELDTNLFRGEDDELVLGLVERCATAGEIGAACYCFERLESMYTDSEVCQVGLCTLPVDTVHRSFTALKSLLRPGRKELLQVPSKGSGPVRKPRKSLARCLERLSAYRRHFEDPDTTNSKSHGAALSKLAMSLAPHLARSSSAAECHRRGLLADIICKLFVAFDMHISRMLAHELVLTLVEVGVVHQRGRHIAVVTSSVTEELLPLAASAQELASAECAAKLRQERRKRRMDSKFHSVKRKRERRQQANERHG